MLEQVNVFRTRLAAQIAADLALYFHEFPNEHAYVTSSFEAGTYIITRTRDELATYDGWVAEARSKIDVRTLVIHCQFPHLPSRDGLFALVLTEDGTVGLSEMSIADFSKYLLSPVLFCSLISDDPPEPSEAD
jgi:hypothetical protein